MNKIAFIAAIFWIVTLAGCKPSATSTGRGLHAHYSEEQANKGQQLYRDNCGKCHLGNLKGNCPGENLLDLSYVCATPGSAPPLNGDTFLRRWHTIGDLYARVRWSMPADNVSALSPEDNLDIVAYLLKMNGISSGDELRDDVNAMKVAVIQEMSAPASTDATLKEPLNDLGISQGYYTEQQAERGKAYFYASCGVCHTANPNVRSGEKMPYETGLGWHYGSQHRYNLLAGGKWLTSPSGVPGRPQRWDTVADLFNKIATAQPAYDAGGLSPEEYLGIVAYLLKQNGYPAGKEDLRDDLAAMRNMTLDPGFTRVFNGKDFTGWGFVVGSDCTPRPEGCAQTAPGTTFIVENQMIHDYGRPHGYAYPDKKYLDFTLRFEYRFDPYKGMQEEYDLYTNTGYLLFITKHDVWPSTMEIQGKANFELSINPMDGDAKYTFDDNARAQARRPPGQWNSVEITSDKGQVWNYLNGVLVSHVTSHTWKEPGYIGFQSESGEVHWRNIRIKEL